MRKKKKREEEEQDKGDMYNGTVIDNVAYRANQDSEMQ